MRFTGRRLTLILSCIAALQGAILLIAACRSVQTSAELAFLAAQIHENISWQPPG